MNDDAAHPRDESGTPPDEPSAPAIPEELPAPPPPQEPPAPPPPEDPPAFPPPEGPPAPPPPDDPAGAATHSSARGFARDQLVRPRQGRYVAGVCAALARATNTDPVLWRVLVAVLGVFSGVGVLLYLVGWLIIPSEGDTASPIESLLGKGRSGLSPVWVMLLGAAAVLSFAFIVQDGMRASLLAAAVVLGAVLLIRRRGAGAAADATAGPAGSTASFGTPSATAPPDEPATVPFPPAEPPPGYPSSGYPAPGYPPASFSAPGYPPPGYQPPEFQPPAGGYRPPFAPHGPWGPSAGSAQPSEPAPGRPPRERSKLGRLTFFAVLVVIGLMVVLQMAGAGIATSAYFAAALVTIALGLIVGGWLGRARGLIALAVLCTFGLAVSTTTERYGGQIGQRVYRPATLAEVASRYDFKIGSGTLDLSGVTFTGQPRTVTATMRFGELKVLLPPTVDTTATVRVQNGWAEVLGHEVKGHDVGGTSVTDLGTDGAGGGTLRLDLQMDTGNVEVSR